MNSLLIGFVCLPTNGEDEPAMWRRTIRLDSVVGGEANLPPPVPPHTTTNTTTTALHLILTPGRDGFGHGSDGNAHSSHDYNAEEYLGVYVCVCKPLKSPILFVSIILWMHMLPAFIIVFSVYRSPTYFFSFIQTSEGPLFNIRP